MTALTQDVERQWSEGKDLAFDVAASSKIYTGAQVAVNAAGYLVPGADAAGLIFVGFALSSADNASGGDGDQTVVVRRRGLARMTAGSPVTEANVGDAAFLVDDATVDLVANVTHNIFCGVIARVVDAANVWLDIEPAIRQADVAAHIADTSGAHAASAISILDSGGYTAQTQVEAALQEIYPRTAQAIADPGNAGAIPVTKAGVCAFTTTGAQTRTLAIPAIAGIVLALCLDVDGGDCVVTAAAAINQTGNNTITLGDAGDVLTLISVQKAGALAWRVLANDGCALTTV